MFIQPLVQSRCASASSSGLPENSGLKFDQFKCTNGCPCGTCGTCGACGTAGPGGGGDTLHLSLPYLTYIISNLCFNYYSSIIVLLYSSCVTLSPCFLFYFLSSLYLGHVYLLSVPYHQAFLLFILIPCFLLQIKINLLSVYFPLFFYNFEILYSDLYFIFKSQLVPDEIINFSNV